MSARKVNETYEGIRQLVLQSSAVQIVRKPSVSVSSNYFPWAVVDGEIEDGGDIRPGEDSSLFLEKFVGTVRVPFSRRTNIVAIGSALEGDHPLGRIEMKEGSNIALDPPGYADIFPRLHSQYLSHALNLSTLAAVSGLTYLASGFGSRWSVGTSLLVGTTAAAGLATSRSASIVSAATAAAITVTPEILGRDSLDGEDAFKLLAGVAILYGAKGIKRAYNWARNRGTEI